MSQYRRCRSRPCPPSAGAVRACGWRRADVALVRRDPVSGFNVLGIGEREGASAHEVVEPVFEHVLGAGTPPSRVRLRPQVRDHVGAAELERDEVTTSCW
jgi:hypothetical protein